MIKRMIILGLVIGMGVSGCEQWDREPAGEPEPGDEAVTPAPTPTPERPVSPQAEEPQAEEPTPEAARPEEPAAEQESTTTQPSADQGVGMGETPDDERARSLIESASDPQAGEPVAQEAAQDLRLTGTWVSQDRQTRQGQVQDRISFQQEAGAKVMTWSAQLQDEQAQVDQDAQAPQAPPPPLAEGMSAQYWFDEQGRLVLQYGPERRLLHFKPQSPEAQAAAAR